METHGIAKYARKLRLAIEALARAVIRGDYGNGAERE